MEEPSYQKNFKKLKSVNKDISTLQVNSKITKPPQVSTMPVPVNKYNKMIEMYNNIRNLINRPRVDIEGLRKLLSKVQSEEMQNLHPITRDITERTIHYIIEINYDNEEHTCNDKMDMLASNLDKITNIVRSGAIIDKKDEIKQVWFKQGKLTELEPAFDNLVHITQMITEATINLLYHTTRASLHPHWFSSDEEEEEEEIGENPEDDHDEIIFLDENNEENNLQQETREDNNLYWTDY